jgi:hypothetical protein
MRSLLYHGRFIAPQSFELALRRQKALAHECLRIEGQLEDETRRASMGSAYGAWRESASHALKVFRSEEIKLNEWIEKNSGSVSLLKEAYRILQVIAAETDLEPDEIEFLKKLDEYFSENKKKPLTQTRVTE